MAGVAPARSKPSRSDSSFSAAVNEAAFIGVMYRHLCAVSVFFGGVRPFLRRHTECAGYVDRRPAGYNRSVYYPRSGGPTVRNWSIGLLSCLMALLLLGGCGPELSKSDLGTVVFEVPKVAGVEEPYQMPQLGPPPKEDEAAATGAHGRVGRSAVRLAAINCRPNAPRLRSRGPGSGIFSPRPQSRGVFPSRRSFPELSRRALAPAIFFLVAKSADYTAPGNRPGHGGGNR